MAKVTSLGLTNFKSVGSKKQTITLAPLTLLFGPNSAGKSTILQALIYLNEIINNRNNNPDRTELGGDWLDLGGFENVVHCHNLNESIEFEVGLELDSDDLLDYRSPLEIQEFEDRGLPDASEFYADLKIATIRIKLRWSHSLNKVVVERYEIDLNGYPVASLQSSMDGRQVSIESLVMGGDMFRLSFGYLYDEASFYSFFGELLSNSILEQQGKRPYINYNIDKLEALLGDTIAHNRVHLLQLKDELTHRTRKRSLDLAEKVNKLLDDQGYKFIGLQKQNDALPIFESGLQVTQMIWRDSDDHDDDLEMRKCLAQNLLNSAICGPLQCLSDWLKKMVYIGPLRDLPPRNIVPQMTIDRSRWAKGLAAWEVIPKATKKQLALVNHWLGEDRLRTGYQVQAKKYRELCKDSNVWDLFNEEMDSTLLDDIKSELKSLPQKIRVTLKEQRTGIEVMPQDVGVGISQLFPVVALAVLRKTGLAAIEQPELHIHPRLQVELADLFINAVNQNNVMFLLETHSEHLLLRLLRRIRENGEEEVKLDQLGFELPKMKLKPEDVAVHYVEPTSAGTKFRQLRVDEDGDFLDRWPQGFFVERREELM